MRQYCSIYEGDTGLGGKTAALWTDEGRSDALRGGGTAAFPIPSRIPLQQHRESSPEAEPS